MGLQGELVYWSGKPPGTAGTAGAAVGPRGEVEPGFGDEGLLINGLCYMLVRKGVRLLCV